MGEKPRPMFRFTIRDLLWLIALAVIGAAWRVDRIRLYEKARDAQDTARIVKGMKDEAEDQREELAKILNAADPSWRETRGPFRTFRFSENAVDEPTP